jgi:rhodanese-related sulfurtransferase
MAAGMGVLLALAAGCGQGARAEESISDEELATRIEQGTAPLILDVRSEQEYRAGHIPGALNIPHDELSERFSELGASESDEIVVHCQSGRRAAAARTLLEAAGFRQIRDLEGHMQGWRAAGRPTE